MPKEKLFYLPRGVDVQRFKPGKPPPIFRAIFSGALIERKGIHHLLEAWHRLNLKDAELWLLGSIHEEAKPHLKKFWRGNIRTIGFAGDVETYLSQATIHIFPSQLEGSAKVTYEAAACGLPQVVTRESGDVVRDGIEGIIVPPGRCRCHRRRHRAFLPASENRVGNGHCRAQAGSGKFHLGPFSGATAGGLWNGHADAVAIASISNGGHRPPLQ